MEEVKRDTVGKISTELLSQDYGKVSVIDQQREMQKDYIDELVKCVELNKKRFPGNFFIVVETKTEKLMANVMRNYFFARWTCPTPTYDESVFRYNRQEERIEYLWSIPSRPACYYIRDNIAIIDKSEEELKYFVLGFFDGSLLRKAKELNNEKHDTILLEK
jgi:RNA-binding protein YhbY